MKECEHYQELISRMIDGDLSAQEKTELANHLKLCPECADLYRAFNAVSGAIAQGLEEPPEELGINIMAKVRRAAIRKRNRRWTGVLASAACLALIVAAAYSLLPGVRAGSGVMMEKAADAEFSQAAAAPTIAPMPRPEEAPAAAAEVVESRELPLPEPTEPEESPEEVALEESHDFMLTALPPTETDSTAVEPVCYDLRGIDLTVLLEGEEAEPPADRQPDEIYYVYVDMGYGMITMTVSIWGEDIYYELEGNDYHSNGTREQFYQLLDMAQ